MTDRSATVSCYTSKKNEAGEYITDFSGIVRFVGAAAQVVLPLINQQDRVTVKILNCAVDGGLWDSETKISSRYSFTVFDCENVNFDSKTASPPSPPKAKPAPKPKVPEDDIW